MKNKIINNIFLVAVILLGLISCNDREIVSVDQGNAPIVMDLSTSELALDKNFPDNPALTVSWSAASYSVPVEIKYDLEISATEDFATPKKLGSTSQSLRAASFTTVQMNSAAESIGLPADAFGNMYMRVVAYLGTGDLKEVSNTTLLKIKPYKLVFPSFYLVGDASYVGWNAGNAQKLYQSDPTDKFSVIYTYLEKDKNFRFLGQKDWNGLNYSIDMAGTKTDYRYFKQVSDNIIQAPGDDENMKFIGETGIYKITINADKAQQSLKAELSPIPGYDFAQLYIVGNVAGNNWDISNAVAMTKTGVGTYEFTTTLPDASEFKFVGQKSWGDLDWGNLSANGNTGYLAPKGSNGNIKFDGGGSSYKITVNLKAATYTLTKL